MVKFPTRFKELRISRDLSQQKLADYLGISKSSVNMYERGEREPGLETLETIADFFNVDMNYLLGKTNTSNALLIQKTNNLTQDENDVLGAYKKLDTEDKAEIRGEMKQMLKADKYKMEINIPMNAPSRKIAAHGARGTKQTTPPPKRKTT